MSYDFALSKLCSHEVMLEEATIDPISKSYISLQKPPANSQVKLYIDGFEVPYNGLYSFPALPFLKSEPYRISAGVNDLIYVKIGTNAPQLIQLITGLVGANEMAADLQVKLPQLNWTVVNKHVIASSPVSGAFTAFSFPDPRWTDRTQSLPSTSRILNAYQALGIIPGRCAVGKQLYPAWDLIPDPSSPDETGKIIHLVSPLFNSNPTTQVSYVTDSFNCRRCHGTQIEFDYNIQGSVYETVQGVDLLAQEFDKFLFTKIGSHFKWNWLGSTLVDRIGTKGSTATASINSLISLDISRAFQTYQNIKAQQDQRFPFQQVSDAEYPLSLAGVNVQIPPQDPTIAIVVSTLVSRSRIPVQLQRVIGNPNPFTQLGNPTAFLQRG